jgi:hypothetical protein
VFFARAPADTTNEEIHALFSQYGEVQAVNIYRSWCVGIMQAAAACVQMSDSRQAANV